MTRAATVGLALLAAAGTAPASRAAGQVPFHPGTAPAESVTVVLSGAADAALDRRLRRLLRSEPVIIAADSRLPAGDTITRSVLVVDATLVLEGEIRGDLVIAGGGAFVRPGAVVRGDLVNVAGGLYRSELSHVGGRILDLPNAPYQVTREPGQGRIVIHGSEIPSPLALDGYMGLHTPTYDRVNGITAVWGARLRFPMVGNVTPSIHAQAGWTTDRGEPTYEADAGLHWIGTRIGVGYEHGWATNDRWLRGDNWNSLNYLWHGKDYRDYNAVDRAWASIAREFGDVAKSLSAVVSLTGQVEDASSLEAGRPWSILADTVRPNPPVDEGRIASGIAALDLEWRGQQTLFDGRLEYESAGEIQGGDFTFDRVSVRGSWAMHALFRHTLEIDAFAQAPIRGEPLPRQRWSFVGGSGTLQTLPVAAQEGDHVVFVETRYIIPLPTRLSIPVLGAPDFGLVHAAGSAWTADREARFRQEVGAQLQFMFLYLRYMMQPRDPEGGTFNVGLTWPFGSPRPWER